MSKRRNVRCTQKIMILSMVFMTSILIFFILKAPSLKISLSYPAVFSPPKQPELTTFSFDSSNNMRVPGFILHLASNNQILLMKLRNAGWPAYMIKDEIFIGPYLKTFRSQIDPAKISQITAIPVRIVDIPILHI